MFKVLHKESAITTLQCTVIHAVGKADCRISAPAPFSARRNLAENWAAGCRAAVLACLGSLQLRQAPQTRSPLVISFWTGLGSLSALSDSDWWAARLEEISITPWHITQYSLSLWKLLQVRYSWCQNSQLNISTAVTTYSSPPWLIQADLWLVAKGNWIWWMVSINFPSAEWGLGYHVSRALQTQRGSRRKTETLEDH